MEHTSAGILLYRTTADDIEVLLVHPGGPFWAKKDDGAWSIPKGLTDEAEEPLTARNSHKTRRAADVLATKINLPARPVAQAA